MKQDNSSHRFEIVRPPQRESIRNYFCEMKHQGNLFPSVRKGLLIFVYFPDVTSDEFKATICQAKPSKILELRPAPRFDIGNLNRESAFRLFAEEGSSYVDLTTSGAVKANGWLSRLETFLKESTWSPDRPVVMLLNKRDLTKEAWDTMRCLISSNAPQFTDFLEVPSFVQVDSERARSTSA